MHGLGVYMDRYSFIVEDFHSVLLAGFSGAPRVLVLPLLGLSRSTVARSARTLWSSLEWNGLARPSRPITKTRRGASMWRQAGGREEVVSLRGFTPGYYLGYNPLKRSTSWESPSPSHNASIPKRHLTT